MESPLILWIVSWIFTLIFYAIYLRSIIIWETKPHIYTAMLYALMTGLIFYSQLSNDAGIWAIYLWITFMVWSIIFFMSFKYWVKDIVLTDKISLLLALISIPIWYISWTPLITLLLVILIDLLSTVPTVRKTFVNPYTENTYVYLIEFIAISFSILALSSINFINAGYLIYIMLFDLLMFFIIYYRRKQLSTPNS